MVQALHKLCRQIAPRAAYEMGVLREAKWKEREARRRGGMESCLADWRAPERGRGGYDADTHNAEWHGRTDSGVFAQIFKRIFKCKM